MDNVQSARLNSIIKSDDVLDDNSVVVGSIAAIPPLAAALKAKMLEIMDVATKGEKNTKGITLDKEQQKAALIAQVKLVARGTAPHLKTINDLDNLERVTFNDSDFAVITGDKLYRVAGEVHAIALANVLNLVGITGTDVSDLLAMQANFLDVMPDPKRATEIKKGYNAQIDPLIKEGFQLRDDLDIYMQALINAHPNLYNEWKFSLSIDDIGSKAEADLIVPVTVPANGTLTIDYSAVALAGNSEIKLLNFSAGDLEEGFGADGISLNVVELVNANTQKRKTATSLGYNPLTALFYNLRNNNPVYLDCKVEFYIMD